MHKVTLGCLGAWGEPDHTRKSEEVVKLLTPTMNELIEKAVQQGMSQLKQELKEQARSIEAMEGRTGILEDEQTYLLAAASKAEKHIQTLLDKV